MDVGSGAAGVAWRLFQAYQAAGVSTWLVVGRKRTVEPAVIAIPNEQGRSPWARGWQRVSGRLERTNPLSSLARPLGRACAFVGQPVRELARMRGREDLDFPASRRILDILPRRPDVLHAHNLHGNYFDLRVLPELSRQVPVLLTLHDAWLLSGHCAHSLECDRWTIGCGSCPDLTLYPSIARDATRYNWNRKRDIFSRSRLHIATPSRWLMGKVEKSILAPAVQDVRVVPNGVNLAEFGPGDAGAARHKLGLSQDAVVLLAVGTAVRRNVWKDYQALREAARIIADGIRDRPVILLVLGDASPGEAVGAAEVVFVPYTNDPSVVTGCYRAADVLLHAARVDTFPSAVLEAMACGTPVVATAVGGVVEQIVDGETGFLVPPADPGALAARALHLLTNATLRHAVAAGAVRDVRARFSLEMQVNSYLNWYETLARRG